MSAENNNGVGLFSIVRDRNGGLHTVVKMQAGRGNNCTIVGIDAFSRRSLGTGGGYLDLSMDSLGMQFEDTGLVSGEYLSEGEKTWYGVETNVSGEVL